MPVCIYLLAQWKYWRFSNIKILAWYVIFKTSNELLGWALYQLKVSHNHNYISALYASVELLFITLFLTAQSKYRFLRKPYLYIGIIVPLSFMGELWSQPLVFPNIGRTLQILLVLCMSIHYGYLWDKEGGEKYELMAILAFVGYFIISIFTFTIVNIVPKSIYELLFIASYVANTFSNIVLGYSFYSFKKWLAI